MPRYSLAKEEKLFFTTVYDATFANPFSELRKQLDRKIAGLFPTATQRQITDTCIAEVSSRLRALEAKNKGNINLYQGQDKEILSVVYLFDMFYAFREDFDCLIRKQIDKGDEPVLVPFVDDVREFLVSRGFSEQEFYHFFALGFQLRRAFYFISQTLIGSSKCMKTLKKHLWYNVFSYNMQMYTSNLWNRMEDFSTMLLGETGTGKGTAAKAIGQSGYIPFDIKNQCFLQSFTQAFSSLNLSQYPETLLEAELFGYTKGAFTGAVESHQGMFARCSPHGSILLDEIGEIPSHVQIKLLKVLQERHFSPVGSHARIRFNGRVIAATNRPKKDIMEGRVFRDDFYYRLCSDIIEVPPLQLRIRENPSELDDLLNFIIERMTGMDPAKLREKVKRIIQRRLGPDYSWPGNVREMEQCVRSVLLRRDYTGKSREKDNIPSLSQWLHQGIADKDITTADLVSGYCRLVYESCQTYEKTARITGLDRRTVKKYITQSTK